MAGTVTNQTLLEGSKHLVVKSTIAGDADLSAALLIDISTFTGGKTASTCKLLKMEATLSGFSAKVYWDATTDVLIAGIPDAQSVVFDYTPVGGLKNNAGTGITGDIVITTTGLVAGDSGTITLYLVKK